MSITFEPSLDPLNLVQGVNRLNFKISKQKLPVTVKIYISGSSVPEKRSSLRFLKVSDS